MKEGVDTVEIYIMGIRIEGTFIGTRMHDIEEEEPINKFNRAKENVEFVLGFLDEDPQLARC